MVIHFLLAWNHCRTILCHRCLMTFNWLGSWCAFPLQIVVLSNSPCLGITAAHSGLCVGGLITWGQRLQWREFEANRIKRVCGPFCRKIHAVQRKMHHCEEVLGPYIWAFISVSSGGKQRATPLQATDISEWHRVLWILRRAIPNSKTSKYTYIDSCLRQVSVRA
jgi:hypothetical protein